MSGQFNIFLSWIEDMDEKYRKENPGEREEKRTERKRGEKLILVVCQAEERQNFCA